MDDQKIALENRILRLLEKIDGLNAKAGAAAADAHSARQKKEAIAGETRKLKEARSALADQARALAAKLRSRYLEAEKIAVTAPSRKLKKELDDLEWAFQTHAGTYAEEMRMWGEMGRLDSMLKRSMERDGIMKDAKEMLRQLETLRKAHDEKHAQVMSLSKEWDVQDAEMQRCRSRIAGLRKERDEANESIRTAKTELDAIYAKERAERGEATAARRNAEKKIAEEENALLKKKAQEVLEKLRSGKKLTGDDLFIMQKANL